MKQALTDPNGRVCRATSLGESQLDAPVLAALFLDLLYPHRTDFAGAFDMGAAAGLQVDPGNIDQANAPRALWWLNRQRLDQLRIGLQFGLVYPA